MWAPIMDAKEFPPPPCFDTWLQSKRLGVKRIESRHVGDGSYHDRKETFRKRVIV